MLPVKTSAFTIVATLLVFHTAWANVGNKAQWKPAFSVEVHAPPPADAGARAKAFAERNSNVVHSLFFSTKDTVDEREP